MTGQPTPSSPASTSTPSRTWNLPYPLPERGRARQKGYQRPPRGGGGAASGVSTAAAGSTGPAAPRPPPPAGAMGAV